MDIVPRRLALGLGIAALVLCGAVAPIQWAQGNTSGALVLAFFALVSAIGIVSAARRRPGAESGTSAQPRAAAPTSPAPVADDSRWHVETLADHVPDPAARRTVVRTLLAVGIACAVAMIAFLVGAGVSGELTLVAFAVLLAVPAGLLIFAALRNRAEL